MKTIPPPCPEPDSGPKYWRSLDHLAENQEFRRWVENEFPSGVNEMADPVSRRHFVQIMSASFLLAGFGLTGCRRPVETILPFSKAPENYVHGKPQFFATAMPTRGSAIPLLAKSNDGRPTKVEGNPQHPDSNGATDRFAQASILGLYDPDRTIHFRKGANTTTREEGLSALSDLAGQAKTKQGAGLSFLLEQSSSPSRARLQQAVSQKLPQAKWYSYEPVDFSIHRQAASAVLGKPVTPYFKLDAAKVIVSLDCDFIGSEEDSYIHIRRFAKGRRLVKPTDTMSRLYVVEGLYTLTGANADHRLRVAPSQTLAIAARLAQEVLKQSGAADFSASLATLAGAAKANEKWIVECAKDLLASGGQGVVVAGYTQPLAVHVIATAINVALGSVGKTVDYHAAPDAELGGIAELAQALNAGQVENLVIVGGNPVYNAPADLDWVKTQRKAKNVVRLGYYEDETFAVSDWHLPLAHYLESWGDARTADGTVVAVQPLIEPLFGGITELEVLARVGGLDKAGPYEIVRETFRGIAGASEESWKKFLHDGFLADSASPRVSVQMDWSAATKVIADAKPLPAPGQGKLEVIFHRDYKLDDGRFNNNGWLLELPDPVTKMTWENVILLSEKTAKDLGVESHDPERAKVMTQRVKVTLNGRTVEGPVWIQPGQADDTVSLALGYGREKTGRVGKKCGYNAYLVRATGGLYLAAGASVAGTGESHQLATTQHHGSMEGRPIIREANMSEFQKNPRFAKGMNMEAPPSSQPLYPNPLDELQKKATHAWGMSIDLNSCVGCSACVVACQSENNIPIVGKDQVARGREMHWIRIDRYYAGEVTDPQMVNQPMLCQHCESAPCESVCPVNATVHDEEGLNVMVYNRCVGTRYCSNNCPYKVRRFNYFDFNKRPLDRLYDSPLWSKTDGEWELKRWFKDVDRSSRPEDEWELLKLVKNPDVTVRMRGVMEKCSFCVQRIEQAKIAQKVKAGPTGDVEVPDGTIQTACQQACPAEAIVFGNIKDPNSRVSKLKAQERNYSVLEFLATRPRLTYLARVRNPNPAMPDYQAMPLSLKEWEEKGNEIEGSEPHAEHEAGAEKKAEKGARE